MKGAHPINHGVKSGASMTHGRGNQGKLEERLLSSMKGGAGYVDWDLSPNTPLQTDGSNFLPFVKQKTATDGWISL